MSIRDIFTKKNKGRPTVKELLKFVKAHKKIATGEANVSFWCSEKTDAVEETTIITFKIVKTSE